MNDEIPRVGLSRGLRWFDVLLWCGAAVIVLTAHAGATAWLLRKAPLMAAEYNPPAAIMIEFAETPEAILTDENEISPDQEMSEAVQETEKAEVDETLAEDAPEDTVQETEKAEDEETLPEKADEPDLHDEEIVARLDEIEVPIPLFRPTPPERKSPELPKKPERTKQIEKPRKQQVAARPAVQAKARVAHSERNAGRQAASGLFSSQTPARWQSRLIAHLERRKKYPSAARSRREQGTVYVRFSIDDSGNVSSVKLTRSSGFQDLDNEVLALVRRASPVPAPPPGVNKTITAPVRFSLR